MAKIKGIETTKEIDVIRIDRGVAQFAVIGERPLIMNRMSQKAMRELLSPRKKTAADKASRLKHSPLDEFRASPYRIPDRNSPTLLGMPATAFKGALRSAALDMPGANKTEIGRLTYVPPMFGELICIYGEPLLFMKATRSSDMKRTPDIRTRAILPEWAAYVSVAFVMPNLREQAVINLLAAAGMTIGIGDWRPEKGAGDFGRFRLCSPDDPDFERILKAGQIAQLEALERGEPYDEESAELLAWFKKEATDRGFPKEGAK